VGAQARLAAAEDHVKPGDVRQTRVEGRLLLILGMVTTQGRATWPLAWHVLDLEDGTTDVLTERWIVHDTRDWNFYA